MGRGPHHDAKKEENRGRADEEKRNEQNWSARTLQGRRDIQRFAKNKERGPRKLDQTLGPTLSGCPEHRQPSSGLLGLSWLNKILGHSMTGPVASLFKNWWTLQ